MSEMIRGVQIRAAEASDWPSIVEVLESRGLPSDVIDRSSHFFHVAMSGEQVVGCACAEQFDGTVLVRSVGVLWEYRDERIAIYLIGAVLNRAYAEGCTKAVFVIADGLNFITHCDFQLAEPAIMSEEVVLSSEFLRKFGARGLAKPRID
ncbi:GNAT family N-acetyltransferase [Cupriavidus sp. CV2]|uniref:GNAT family N-acetyltransferase n=1 Tax=Cupriavidus ulmosensis TaxID=3065913 RepID=UPI00296B4682|nr:GNAT family N-acetyltransferase [Cupriavidus sp. CV2]MDW3683012.1 GNAT family N-acetyltransferase [Cupriavidus sp. CV2]